MATDLLDILRKGELAWDRWRAKNLDAEIDFTGVDLRRANLRRLNLSWVDLSKADLEGASLQGAHLNLSGLRWANLRGTDLSSASLRGTDLSMADLSGADLRGTYVMKANLRGANVSQARLSETVLADVDLQAVIGLDLCDHEGPSIIDHRTLMQSIGLPLEFLQGCGLPDTLIENLPRLRESATSGFYSCFISYSTQDHDFADRLHADLQINRVRCWFAPHDIHGGRKIHEQIDEAIRLYDKLLLILSPASIRSPWVETEIRKARKREVREQRRMLFPLRLIDFDTLQDWECFDADTGKDLAIEVREYFIPDFSLWKTDHDAYTQAFERLLKDLRSEKAVGA